ncbi:MAG: phosphoribosyltransferase [Anaerolineae bacterium]|nr:phosphoribosyltransferase [Anaerolineae bacterium]
MGSSRNPLRQEWLTWNDIDKLVDVLLPQLRVAEAFDAMIMITRGGIIPGGLLCEALGITHVFTAAVDFPRDLDHDNKTRLLVWPSFLQFPADSLIADRRLLIVDDVWGSGRTITSVKSRCQSAGAKGFTCVFHFNPYRSLFSRAEPDFYGAVTDAYIVYPWEIDRGLHGISTNVPGSLPDSN